MPAALARAVEEDRAAGHLPFCVVATVGTTSTSSIDPVPAIAELCERERLWLHVDAAYAGSAAVVPELRHILDGSERADSLVLNPHKWLMTPFDLSVLYTRRMDLLHRAFSLVPEYLRTLDHGARGRPQPLGVRHPARPPLPRPQVLDGPPLLRPRRSRRAHPRALPPRTAVRLVGRIARQAGNCSRPSP